MKAFVAALGLGGRVAMARLGGRTIALIAGCAVAFCALAAFACSRLERTAGQESAVSQALWFAAFGLVIPLASSALTAASLSRRRLQDAVECVGLLGADRRPAALGALLVTSLVSAATGMLAAAITVLVARAPWSAGAMHDVITSSWIGALTGCAYVFYFGAASTIGPRGGGRVFALVADWLLGPLVGSAAVVFPRAHALNLLGAAPVMELSQQASAGILIAMIAAYAALAVLRTRP